MRRQASATGDARDGSSPFFGLDPLRLPLTITAADPAADEGHREIAVSADGIEFRRSLRGEPTRARLRYGEFKGLAVRVIAPGACEPMIFLSLEHEDDSLSVLLYATENSDECAEAARKWSRITGCPILIADGEGRLRNPASLKPRIEINPRRKRRSVLRFRRSAVRARSQRANLSIESTIYSGEREIIARS